MFKLCQLPVPIRRHERKHLAHHPASPTTNFKTDSSTQKCTATNPCPTTLSVLNKLYGIKNNNGSSSLSQAVFETNGESFLQMDLTTFQTFFNVPLQEAKVVGMTPFFKFFTCAFGFCVEGSLDIQVRIIIILLLLYYYYYYITTQQTTITQYNLPTIQLCH